MARDRAKDNNIFDASQDQEHNDLVRLYPLEQRPRVRAFLLNSCANNTITKTTHREVYKLIQTNIGYPEPV